MIASRKLCFNVKYCFKTDLNTVCVNHPLNLTRHIAPERVQIAFLIFLEYARRQNCFRWVWGLQILDTASWFKILRVRLQLYSLLTVLCCYHWSSFFPNSYSGCYVCSKKHWPALEETRNAKKYSKLPLLDKRTARCQREAFAVCFLLTLVCSK